MRRIEEVRKVTKERRGGVKTGRERKSERRKEWNSERGRANGIVKERKVERDLG